MTRLTLDARTHYYFERLLRNRKKVDFLAHFPEEGVVELALIKGKVFGNLGQPTVNHHLDNYRSFFNSSGRIGKNGLIRLTLNEEGEELQKIARYMVLMNEEINSEFGTEVDFLDIYPVRAKPRRTLMTLSKVYFNGNSTLGEIFGEALSSSSIDSVGKLESLGLLKPGKIVSQRKNILVHKTELGTSVFYKLILPVVGYITSTCDAKNCELDRYLQNGQWEEYVKRNGNGWADKLKNP